MDPLSLTASIATIIAAANAGIKGLRKLDQLCRGPTKLGELLSELENVENLLKDISDFATHNQQLLFSAALLQCVERAGAKIEQVNKLLESAPFKLPKSKDAGQARLIWFRHQDRLGGLSDDLRVIRLDLAVRLSLIEASSSCRLEDAVKMVIYAQDQMSYQMSKVLEELTANKKIQLSIEASEPEYTDIFASQPYAGKEAIAPQDLVLKDSTQRSGCVGCCSCACHARKTFTSPLLLNPFFGEIRIQYSSQQPRCDRLKCQREGSTSLCVTYQFPNYALRRYVSLYMKCMAFDGPQFCLKIPRVMEGRHLLWTYTRIGELADLQQLFSRGIASPHDVNSNGSNSLVYAGNRGKPEIVKFLLQQGVDPDLPNEAGRTATDALWDYAFAGRLGSKGISHVSNLLADNDYIRTRRFSILHKIVLGIVKGDLRTELEHSVVDTDIKDVRGRTALFWATLRNHEEAVRILLSFGANPSVRDDFGISPLHFVRKPSLCSALIAAGANVGACRAYYGRSALHQGSLAEGNVDVANLLIRAGVDKDILDADGETPLMNAIHHGLNAMALRLIEIGANIHLTNFSGRYSALHFAVESGRYDIIPVLLQRGVDTSAVTVAGETIAHLAARSAGKKTMAILAEANLDNIDSTIRNCDGKTAAEIFAERLTMKADTSALNEQFCRFLASIEPNNDRDPALSFDDHNCSGQDEPYIHLPGAYPTSVR